MKKETNIGRCVLLSNLDRKHSNVVLDNVSEKCYRSSSIKYNSRIKANCRIQNCVQSSALYGSCCLSFNSPWSASTWSAINTWFWKKHIVKEHITCSLYDLDANLMRNFYFSEKKHLFILTQIQVTRNSLRTLADIQRQLYDIQKLVNDKKTCRGVCNSPW